MRHATCDMRHATYELRYFNKGQNYTKKFDLFNEFEAFKKTINYENFELSYAGMLILSEPKE